MTLKMYLSDPERESQATHVHLYTYESMQLMTKLCLSELEKIF